MLYSIININLSGMLCLSIRSSFLVSEQTKRNEEVTLCLTSCAFRHRLLIREFNYFLLKGFRFPHELPKSFCKRRVSFPEYRVQRIGLPAAFWRNDKRHFNHRKIFLILWRVCRLFVPKSCQWNRRTLLYENRKAVLPTLYVLCWCGGELVTR